MQPVIKSFANGIHQIDADYVAPGVASVYLIQEGERLALIEAGTNNTVPHILATIEQLGYTPEHLDYVIPTHVHLDHAAGAGAIMQACPNAQLVIHPRGARHMVDPTKLEAGTRAVYGDEKYEQLYGALVAVDKNRVIEAPDNIQVDFNGRILTFLDTPGHAKHHFCVYDGGSNCIFSGDTFGLSYRPFDTENGEVLHFVTTTPVHFDPEAMRTSIQRLADLQPSQVYLTHYGPVAASQQNLKQLFESLDAFVAIAMAEKDLPTGRTERIADAILDWLVDRALALKPELDKGFARQWLATDANLNAQGLDVWLSSQSASG